MFSTLELENLLKQEVTGLSYLISVFKKADKLSNERYQILLRNRLNSLKILLNRLEADEDTPVERKASLLEDIAVALSDIIFMEDVSEQDELTWYEINALRLQIIARLMHFWGKQGAIRIRGLGLALENILLGLRIPDIKPLMESADEETFLDRLFLALLVLNAKLRIYSGAIQALHEIPWKDFERWAREALLAAEELMDLLEQHWDLERFYRWGKEKDPDLPFIIITNYLAVPLGILSFLLALYQMVGGEWPSNLLSTGFMREGSTDELLATLGGLLRFVESKIEEITTSHVFELNDQPLKDPIMSFYIHHFWRFRLIHEGLALIHFMETSSGSREHHLPRLAVTCEKILELLRARMYLMQDPNYLKTSSGEQLVETLTWFIIIITYHDWVKNELVYLKSFERIVGSYLQDEGLERFPLLGVLFHHHVIAVGSRARNTAVLLRSAKKLERILVNLNFYPRDRLSSALLSHLIMRMLKIERDEEFIENINQEVLLAYKNGISASFLSIVMCHAERLKKAILKPTSRYLDPCRKFKQNVFDSKSFFIPDFEFLHPYSGMGLISHEPLNLEADKIS